MTSLLYPCYPISSCPGYELVGSNEDVYSKMDLGAEVEDRLKADHHSDTVSTSSNYDGILVDVLSFDDVSSPSERYYLRSIIRHSS